MEIQNSTFTSKIAREDDFDYSIVKVVLFLAFNFITLFLGFYYFKLFLENLEFYYFNLSLILFSLFFIFSLLNVLLIKSIKKLFWFSFISVILTLGIFFEKIENFLLIGAFFFFLFLFTGFKFGNEFLKNSLKIKFFNLSSLFFKKILFGFLVFYILVFFVYFFNINTFQFSEKINKFLIESFLNLFKPILYIYFDINNENILLNDLLKNLVLKEINKSIPDFKDYLPSLKEKILNEAVKKYQLNFEEKFGIKLNLEKSLKDNIESGFLNYLNNLNNKSKLYFSIAITFIIFLILIFIFKILSYLYALIAFLIYKFLIVIGFISLSLETRSREFVLMK